MGTINSRDRIVAIVFLRNMVCLRNICINTLHKGDSIFTYNNNNNNVTTVEGNKHRSNVCSRLE
jgi:hypothetical protein